MMTDNFLKTQLINTGYKEKRIGSLGRQELTEIIENPN